MPAALSDAAAIADLPAELPDNEAAYLQELAARPVDRPGTAPQRSRPDASPESAGAQAPAEHSQDQADGSVSPRQDTAPAVDAPRAAADRPVSRLVQVSRRSRSRKAAEAGQWSAADKPKRASSDTSV